MSVLPPHLHRSNIPRAAGQLRVLHINRSWTLILPVYALYCLSVSVSASMGSTFREPDLDRDVRPQLRHASHSQSPVICAKNSFIRSAHYLPSQRDMAIRASPATYYSYYYEYLVDTLSSPSSHSI